MDSPAEIDIDAELEAWLDKMAADAGVSRDDLAAQELEVWRRWKETKDPNDFRWLYDVHQGAINSGGARYLATSQVPKAAIRSQLVKNYITALERFNPDVGVKMTSWIQTNMGHAGRYGQKYGNIAKMPSDRGGLVSLYQNRHAALSESLGRPPTVNELADDMLLSAEETAGFKTERITPKVVATLQRELRGTRLAEGSDQAFSQDSRLRDRAVYLHGSLNPEQQLVLENMYPVFGKGTPTDNASELAQRTGFSEQKIRSIKKQIGERLGKYT